MRQEVKTAIWIAIAGFLWAVLEFVAGFHTTRIAMHATITWFAFVPVLILYIWHYRLIKKRYQEQLTWRRGFLSGLFVTAVAIPLNMLSFLLFYYLINPNLFSAFTKYSVDNKIMSAEEAAKYFSLTSGYLVQIAIGTLIIGILISVILSFIYKSKRK